MRASLLFKAFLALAGGFAFAVQAQTASVAVASSANPSTFGQSVTFTATVSGSGAAPTGTVTFLDGTFEIDGCSAVALASGAAACTTSDLAPGAHSVTAHYSGDASYGAATSSAVTQVVQSPPPSMSRAWTTVTPYPPTVVPGTNQNIPDVGPRTALDAAGNFYAALTKINGNFLCYTYVKYAPDGSISWTHERCDEFFTAFASSIVVDGAGDVFVTGASGNLLYAAKLSGATGTAIWEQRIGPRGSTYNSALAVGVTATGDVRVAGWEGGIITIYAFHGSDGTLQWSRDMTEGFADSKLLGFAVAADGSSVIGYRYPQASVTTTGVLVRLDNFGSFAWTQHPNAGVSNVNLDGSGNVVGRDLDGIGKWDGATGAPLWTYPSMNYLPTVDAAGNVYAAGWTANGSDTVALKLAPDGSVAWRHAWVDASTYAAAVDITLDADGNPVILAGATRSSDGARGQMLFKYAASDGTVLSETATFDPATGYLPHAVQANTQGTYVLGLVRDPSTGSTTGVYAMKLGPGVVAKADPAVALSSSANPSNAGDNVTFQASVSGSGGTATGSVTFNADGSAITGCSAVALASGTASCTTSALSGGSHSITASYSGDGNYNAATSSPLTQTVNAASEAPRLGNISTRGDVLTGENVLIGGFIVGGSTPKTVIVRARGPSLAAFGVANPLANPTLTLVRSSDQSVVATNDNWGDAANASQVSSSGFAPSDPLESAILVTLPPGAYTGIVSGVGGGTGVGIVEVFEIDHPESPLANISTRGEVLTGENVLIGGFIVQGSTPQTVVVRARGPSLGAFGVANPLGNPTLTLVRSSDQSVVATNDDWTSASNAAQVATSGFAPSDPRESAILVTLPPGAYTAIVSGVGGTTGVAIVEIFSTQ